MHSPQLGTRLGRGRVYLSHEMKYCISIAIAKLVCMHTYMGGLAGVPYMH